jgi:hypothetical protein
MMPFIFLTAAVDHKVSVVRSHQKLAISENKKCIDIEIEERCSPYNKEVMQPFCNSDRRRKRGRLHASMMAHYIKYRALEDDTKFVMTGVPEFCSAPPHRLCKTQKLIYDLRM